MRKYGVGGKMESERKEPPSPLSRKGRLFSSAVEMLPVRCLHAEVILQGFLQQMGVIDLFLACEDVEPARNRDGLARGLPLLFVFWAQVHEKRNQKRSLCVPVLASVSRSF